MAVPSIGVLMFVAHRAMEQRILEALRSAGFGDATMAQGRVFARIGEDGTRLTDLAEMAQVTKQTASFLVGQLERSGYVERVVDPSDARARLVRISAKGRDAQEIAAREEQASLPRVGAPPRPGGPGPAPRDPRAAARGHRSATASPSTRRS